MCGAPFISTSIGVSPTARFPRPRDPALVMISTIGEIDPDRRHGHRWKESAPATTTSKTRSGPGNAGESANARNDESCFCLPSAQRATSSEIAGRGCRLDVLSAHSQSLIGFVFSRPGSRRASPSRLANWLLPVCNIRTPCFGVTPALRASGTSSAFGITPAHERRHVHVFLQPLAGLESLNARLQRPRGWIQRRRMY